MIIDPGMLAEGLDQFFIDLKDFHMIMDHSNGLKSKNSTFSPILHSTEASF